MATYIANKSTQVYNFANEAHNLVAARLRVSVFGVKELGEGLPRPFRGSGFGKDFPDL